MAKSSTSSQPYFTTPDPKEGCNLPNFGQIAVTPALRKPKLAEKATSLHDLPRRYSIDREYHQLVGGNLKIFIHENVSSMSLNPIFGFLRRCI
jgi:hypothetical protein